MRLDQFTVKAQEALTAAQTAAEKADHPEVTPEHLVRALLEQEGGVVPAALAKLGANIGAIRQDVERAITSLPHTQGAATHVSPRLDGILKRMPGIPAELHFFVFEPKALLVHGSLLVATAIIAALYPMRIVARLPIAATLRNEVIS